MSTIKYPTNDIARCVFLQTALATDRSDHEIAKSYLMPATREELNRLFPLFSEFVSQRESTADDRKREVREKNETLIKLRMYCLHGITSVKHRVQRLSEPIEILSNYGISSTGKNPRLSLSADLTDQADQIIIGDARTVEQGYPAMVNPTADEISEVNELAKKELAEIAEAGRIIDEVEHDLAELRAKIDILIRDICSDLNYTLRHENDTIRRSIMRSYGVKFLTPNK